MSASDRYSLGFDFGAESVRVLVVDIRNGRIAGQAVENYPHGVIDRELPTGGNLPPDYALQHPTDWLDQSAAACRAAVKQANVSPDQIVGIGVAFTSCTMLPALADGTPLCLTDRFETTPLAWPKLWKHHGAKSETDRINQIARERNEPWLARYGGSVGLEWFFPKILETLEHAPHVYDATQVWLEAGDWFVWQLTSGPFPRCDASTLIRSTCQAGFKALWNRQSGYPSREFFAAVHPKLAYVVAEKMPGTLLAPGQSAGELTPAAAERLGLRPGIPVSAAIIDAHARVPGAGVPSPSTLVMAMGAGSCHMMNSRIEQLVPGVAGVVEEGILPGYFGYEVRQDNVGDAFAQLAKTVHRSPAELDAAAAALPPGSGDVVTRIGLDDRLPDAFIGVTPSTRPEQLYRALIEATAFDLKTIVETFRAAGVPVRRFVASGSLPAKSPLLMQIYADVLDERIKLAESDQPVALGAAILGCLAAGPEVTGHHGISQAIHAMARGREDLVYRPDLDARKRYAKVYDLYRQLTTGGGGGSANDIRELRQLG